MAQVYKLDYTAEEINEKLGKIETLHNEVYLTLLPFVEGYYVKLSGTSVNDTCITESANGYLYSWVNCDAGDKFVINAITGGSLYVYAFLDVNGVILKRDGLAATVENLEIIAPENAATLIINTKGKEGSYSVKDRVEKIEEYNKMVYGDVLDFTKYGYYIAKDSSGKVLENKSHVGYCYINQQCSSGDVFVVNSNVGDVSSYILTDDNNNILYASDNGVSFNNHIVIIPNGVSKIYINNKSRTKSLYLGNSVMKKIIDEISESANNLKEDNSGRDAFGGYNATMRGKQMSNIEYTPVADMEKQVNGYSDYRNIEVVPSGTKCTGMLYSSSQHNGGQLGIDVSLYTFLSAIQNPNSKVYTFKGVDYNGFLWFGSVCTGLVCYALGIPEKLPTSYFMDDLYKGFVEVDPYNVRIGDVMAKNGHVRLVTMVSYDNYGRIKTVEVTESVHSFAKTTTKSFDTYISEINNNGYHIVRYSGLKDIKYIPDGCVIMDGENTIPPTFPDILSDYGDKCAIHEGDDIAFTIINPSGYSLIEIYKDDVLLETKSTVVDFNITNVAAGKYEVRLVGSSKTSSCFFIAIDCTATYEDKTVTFESTYGKLQTVTTHKTRDLNTNGIYNGQTACYGAVIFDNPTNMGTVDVSYAFEHAGGQNITTGDYICLHMLCEYGRVEFKIAL